MTLVEIIKESLDKGVPFKRPSWHYSLWFEEQLGHYTDGYNGMDCSYIVIDDAVATDFELDYGRIYSEEALND